MQAKEQLASLKQKHEDLLYEKKYLQNEYKSVQQVNEKKQHELAEMNASLSELTIELAVRQDDIQRLQTEINSLEAQRTAQQEELTTQQEELSALQSQLNTLLPLKDNWNQSESQIEQLKLKCDALTKSREETLTEAEASKQELQVRTLCIMAFADSLHRHWKNKWLPWRQSCSKKRVTQLES